MENGLKLFQGTEVGITTGENGEVLFELYSSGLALGQVKKNSTGKEYPRKDRIDENVKSAGITCCVHNGHSYLTEENLYDLMLEVKTDKVKPFRKWVTNEVLPTIRKTGGYINNTDLMINTYFGSLDETHKGLIKGLFVNIEEQQKEITGLKQSKKVLEGEVAYKEDVIIGLVDEITLAEKRQILNRVVKRGKNYQERWTELYSQFNMKYHINLKIRLETYNATHKPKMKNRVDYIEKVMNKIPELYEIATKLYENDIKELTEELYALQAN